jgi:hypothetical protein
LRRQRIAWNVPAVSPADPASDAIELAGNSAETAYLTRRRDQPGH